MIPRPNGATIQQLILMVSFTATYLSNGNEKSNQELHCHRRAEYFNVDTVSLSTESDLCLTLYILY